MALFDKLKGIAKDVSKTVTAVAKSAAQEFSEKPNTTPARAPVVELELLDETTLEYTWCDEFELEEIEYRPGEYEIVEYIGFGSVPVNVEIPGVIDGKNIVRLAEKFFKDNKEIRYVKLTEKGKEYDPDEEERRQAEAHLELVAARKKERARLKAERAKLNSVL